MCPLDDVGARTRLQYVDLLEKEDMGLRIDLIPFLSIILRTGCMGIVSPNVTPSAVAVHNHIADVSLSSWGDHVGKTGVEPVLSSDQRNDSESAEISYI